MTKKKAILTATALLFLSACESGMVFDRYGHVSERGWSKQDAVELSVPPLREGGVYEVKIGVRSTDDYPYRNISIIVQRQTFPSKAVHSDTVECKLTDDKGMRIGSGFINYQNSYDVALDHYKAGDSIYIVLKQNMRNEQVEGITDVGVSLRKVE